MTDAERSQRRWTTRRRMAKASFALITLDSLAGIALAATGWIEPEMVTALAAYIAAPITGLFSIIGLYIGYSTKDDLKMAEIASVAD